LTVAGGGARAPYTFSSSNGQIVPVPATSQQSTSLSITPGTVTASQNVSITVRDQAGQTATSNLTVQPNFVAGDITVTGTAAAATGIANCSATGTVCAGQSGVVGVTLSQFGAPAAGRSVRFEAVQGNFRFPTDVAQTQFASAVTVTTDNQGRGIAILRADPGNFQNAIIRATDVATGAFRVASFFIRQPTVAGAEYSLVPSGFTSTGLYKGECPGGVVDFLIFGGVPPFTIRSTIPQIPPTPTITAVESPSRFTVAYPATACGEGGYLARYTVTDAQMRTIEGTLEVKPGTDDRPAPPTPNPSLTVSPTSVTLSCGAAAQVIATILNPGSTSPTVTAAVSTGVSPAGGLTATTSGNVVTITRTSVPANTLAATPAQVTISAGVAGTQTVSVVTPLSCP
jgi:hypothetical protein